MLVELQDVTKTYAGSGGEEDVAVLRSVRFILEAREMVAVAGPSGCGKSTLLNIIGTLDQPTSGRVILFGDDVTDAGPAALARLRAEKIGFVFQLHHLLPQCSVLENVLVPTLALPKSERPSDAEARAKKLLDRVGLSGRLRHRPAQLSGGERQRAAVVRALINGPQLLLADEPTGALDQRTAADLFDLFAELNREEGVAMVVVTHDRSLAGRLGRTCEMADGQVVEGNRFPEQPAGAR